MMANYPNQPAALPSTQPSTAETNFLAGDTALHLRPMQEGDLEQVQAIDQISFSMPWPASAYRYELFHNQHSIQWVAAADLPEKQVAGMIVVWIILDEAHIATLAIHPDFRQKGIACRLILAGLWTAYQKGARQATLEVRAGNQAAISLYQKLRFEVVGRRPRYYKDNQEDALIMTVSPLDEGYLTWLDAIINQPNLLAGGKL